MYYRIVIPVAIDTSVDSVRWLLPVFWDHCGQSMEGVLHLPPPFSQERSEGKVLVCRGLGCRVRVRLGYHPLAKGKVHV